MGALMIGDKRHRRRVPQEEIDAIIDLRKSGMTYAAIGKEFGRTAPAIYWTIYPERRAESSRKLYAKKRAVAHA